jgi:hypothetical protein
MRRLEGDEHLGRAKPHQTSARRSSVARSIGQQPGVIPSIRVTTQLDPYPYPNHENAADLAERGDVRSHRPKGSGKSRG